MAQPSFVTQAQRPGDQKTQPNNVKPQDTPQNEIVNEPDDVAVCCGCFRFGKKKKTQKTTNTNNNNKPDNSGQPTTKLTIPNNNNDDRDQIGINSPRTMERRPVSIQPSKAQALLPPQKKGREGRKCLVLDLDETLVHSSFQPVDKYDFLIPVEIDAKRPFVDEFLKEMGKVYEVVVFTASLSKYADPVLDLLDIHKVIDFRLFREHCTCINDIYVKDMSIMGRPIESVFIIDNSPHAYSLQPENAVPCISWFDDYEDNELLEFIPVLTKVADPSVKNIIHELERLKMNGCGLLQESYSQYTTESDSTNNP